MVPFPPMSEPGIILFTAIQKSGYLIPTICLILLSTGICLVCNRLVSVSLVILAPISINIFLFYLVLDPSGLGGALLLLGLNSLLLWMNRHFYSTMWGNKPPIFTRESIISQLIDQKWNLSIVYLVGWLKILGLSHQDIITYILLYIVPVFFLIAGFMAIYFYADRNRYRRLVGEMLKRRLLEGKS